MSEKKELQKKAKKLGLKLHGRMSEENMRTAIAGADTANQHIEGADAIPQEAQEATKEKIDGVVLPEASDPAAIMVTPTNPSGINIARLEEMRTLALRIWNGQSVSLPRKQREARIISRLKDKGYTDEQLTKLELPE